MEEQRTPNYWAIKTTAISSGHDYYWTLFVPKNVIAIGWDKIERGENAVHAERMIKKFKEIAVGDQALICKGYPPNQLKDVYIYGFAEVTGPFQDTNAPNGWGYRHPAKICRVETYAPVDMLRKTLKMGSMRQTLHQIDNKEGFQQLKSQLCK